MVLDVEDPQLKASIKRLPNDRFRMILDYPAEARYWDQVFDALSVLFRPASTGETEKAKGGGEAA